MTHTRRPLEALPTTVLLLLLTGSGCGQQPSARSFQTQTMRAALSSATSHVIVPAYFPDSDTTDWQTLTQGYNGLAPLPASSVVIAPATSSYDDTLHSYLSALNANGVVVLGYVPAGWVDDTISSAVPNIDNWATNYGDVVSGVFFDEAQRTFPDDVKRFDYLTDYTTQMNGVVMFNISVPDLEHDYVDCAMQVANNNISGSYALFVSQENTETFYTSPDNATDWANSAWSWIDNYMPSHFAQILNGATTDTTTTNTVIGDARTWNAEWIYATDQTTGGGVNTYGTLTNSQIYSDLLAGTNSAHNDFGGTSSDSYTSTCPAECAPGDPCWCAHSECVAGVALDPSCSTCAAEVCTQDPRCCSTGWDASCAYDVGYYCGPSYNCEVPGFFGY